MRRFRAIAKVTLGLYSLSLLVGCNLPSPKDKQDARGNRAATFTAQAVADRSKAMETSVTGPFSLPTSKRFYLQACVKDAAYDKAIQGHEFTIEELDKKVTTDKSGCLNWTEDIDFNYLAMSQYVRIERHILAQGLHKGSQAVAFAINPWSDGSSLPPVLNPDDVKIEKLVEDKQQAVLALKGLSSENKPVDRLLWVEDGRLFATEQKLTPDGNTVLIIDFKATPAIQMTKMNGETFLRTLSTGTFKARLKLIHTYQENNKDIRRLLSESVWMDSKMEHDSLTLKSTMTLPTIPTRGQIMLGLELQPEQGPQGLKAFEGVYLLGEYDQIKGSSFLKLNFSTTTTKDFKLADFINASLAELPRNPQTGKIAADNYQIPKIEISQLEFRYLRIGQEKTAKKEVLYNIKACLRNGLDQKSIRSQSFKITRFRSSEQEPGKTLEVKTDNNACLSWDESITISEFECQRYIKGSVQIENTNLGMNEKMEILLNPWERSGLDARDMRYVDPSQKLPLSCEIENHPKTQIFLAGYSYNTLSYKYSVDSFLNLTVNKKIQLKMDPRLLMYSSLTGGRTESRKLRDGIYLLRTAIVQNQDYDTDNTYVTSADRIVNVIDGQINTELTFQTQDLKALGNRNNLLVEIYPVDENKVTVSEGKVTLKNPKDSLVSVIDSSAGLNSPTFIGPITLNIDDASGPLRMMDASAMNQILLTGQTPQAESKQFLIQKVVEQGLKSLAKTRQQVQQRADKNKFAKENNLDLISLKDADNKAPLVKSLVGSTKVSDSNIVSKSELQEILSSGTLSPHTAHKLCAFWAVDYLRKLNANKGGAIVEQTSGRFATNCMDAVRKNSATFFKVERQLRINEVADSKFLKGLTQGFSVGTDFSVDKSHSESESRATSVDIFRIGLSAKVGFVDIGSGGGYSISSTKSDTDSSINSASVSRSTSMVLQQNIFKVRANKHEQCATVRLNPNLFIKDSNSKWFGLFRRRDYLDILNPHLTSEEMTTATTRGLMICSGEIKNEPKDIIENYYLIYQEPLTTQSQDVGDARNRNFFIALRSHNDFNRFIVAIKGTTNRPVTSDKEEDTQERTTKTMEKLFRLSGPAYPGMYLMP